MTKESKLYHSCSANQQNVTHDHHLFYDTIRIIPPKIYFINRILGPIISDVMNTVTLST
jgi:hypothetical protein